jgi:hypothetical protein
MGRSDENGGVEFLTKGTNELKTWPATPVEDRSEMEVEKDRTLSALLPTKGAAGVDQPSELRSDLVRSGS